MDTFSKLFGSLLALVYHCFDRIVIQGYLPLLTREEHIVHLFRDVHRISPITKEALRARTTEYQQWVEAFARNHRIPIEWPDDKMLTAKGLKREDYVRPYCQRMIRATGSACTASSKAWNKGRRVSRGCRRSRPTTPITAS
jgi:hypothetical protein